MDSHVKVSRPLRLKHHPEKWQVTLRYYDEEGKSLRKRTWRSTGIKINQKSKSIKQTYAEAVVAAQKILAAEQSKKFGEPKRFQEYAREFLNEKEREGSLSLIDGYKSAFASLKRFLKTDQIFMAQITPTKLNQFFSSGHKPSVADSHYRHLNSFFNQAAILGYITENPLAQVDHKPIRKRYKQNMRPRGVLTVRQVELIYEAMPKETFRDITFANFWLFLFGTALRRSEACFLQERNISLTEKQIRIEKTIDYDLKTDSSAGIIPILHHAERAILNQRENKRTSNNLRVQNSPYLFCN
ncbi:MAG TPA: site-specific integrase, partial [Nitrosopumilaceae archaeon]|nr:site-specific integrase [Nitrosopumilaceae archaeon]